MPTEASGSRSRIDLAQCAAATDLFLRPRLGEQQRLRPRRLPAPGSATRVPAACNASSSAARCGSVPSNPYTTRCGGAASKPRCSHQSQPVPQPGAVEHAPRDCRSGRRPRSSRERHGPPRPLGSGAAARPIGTRTRCPRLRVRSAQATPGAAARFRGADSAITRSHRASSCCAVSSRGSRLARPQLGGLPLPLLPGGPWQDVGGRPGAPAGRVLPRVVGAPDGARQAPRRSDYGRAGGERGERGGEHAAGNVA